MAPDPLPSTVNSIPSASEGSLSRVKFRVRFRKAGDLRLVSHHDLMHIFERTFRRANLKLPVTQGFNPRPRMWFALSLALGIAGLNEVLELELSEPLSTEEVQRRLIAHMPPGIDIISVRAIDVRASAHVRRAWYRVPGPFPVADLLRCTERLKESAWWVERSRPRRRRINLRPFISEMHASANLDMALWITPQGAARPEEILTVLGMTALLDDGVVIERTDLEIFDELPAGLEGPPAMETAFEEIATGDQDSPEDVVASSRPTAIMDDPMSFDS